MTKETTAEEWAALYPSYLRASAGDTKHVCGPRALAAFAEDIQADTRAACREKLAQWMIDHSYATGHGDTMDDLLAELDDQAFRQGADAVNAVGKHREREAFRKGAEEMRRDVAGLVHDERSKQLAEAFNASTKVDKLFHSGMAGIFERLGEQLCALPSRPQGGGGPSERRDQRQGAAAAGVSEEAGGVVMTELRPTKQQIRQLRRDNQQWPVEPILIPREKWPPQHEGNTGRNPRLAVLRSRDFLIQLFDAGEKIVRMSVSRTDWDVNKGRWREGISWDDLQWLKDACGFGARDAVEVYPPAADVVNAANMRHLFILPYRLPFVWRSTSDPHHHHPRPQHHHQGDQE